MTLTIYTKPGCFPCRKTVQKFEAAGLAPQAVDITTNADALDYVTEELGYSGAPIVVYDKDGTEDHWSGLNPAKIDQVIAIETNQ